MVIWVSGKRAAVPITARHHARELLAKPLHVRKEEAAKIPRKVELLHARKEDHAEPHPARLLLARPQASHAKLLHAERTEAAKALQAIEALPAQAEQLVAAQAELQAVQCATAAQ